MQHAAFPIALCFLVVPTDASVWNVLHMIPSFALAAAVLTWLLTAGYLRVMLARGRLDVPNARSMHKQPKPAGSGIVAIPIVILAGLLFGGFHSLPFVLFAAALALSLLGWVDDMRGLPVGVRFAAQLLAIVAYLAVLPADARIAPFIPLVAERAVLVLAWGWYVNLFNFMDGIDGIAGSEAVSLALGFLAVAGFAAAGSGLAIAIAAAMLGYLAWNWAPGRVMMGDAGSIPLGYLTGALMLELAFAGHLAAAIILPLTFCFDATYTLARRLLAGKRPQEAHREHFYQRAALGCGSHATVVLGMIATNAVLIAAAALSIGHPILGLGIAVTAATFYFLWLSRLAGRSAPQ